METPATSRPTMSKFLASLMLLTACGAYGQPAPSPSFDVASVKPAPPPTGNGIRVMMGGGPGSRDPGRVNFSNASLLDMIRIAYALKEYQISAPDWSATTRFDVVATLPPDTSREQYLLMWQNLLAERFKLTVHREKRELPAYSLVVAKGGPKLKESDLNDLTPPAFNSGPGGPPPPPLPPPPAPGAGAAGPNRGGAMIMSGRGRLAAKHMTVSALADLLGRQMDRPIVDETGLTGSYDFNLDYLPDEGQRMMMPGMPMLIPAGGGGGGEGRGPADGLPDNNGASIFTALQAQLGLKLEAKKLPLEVVVVDRVERVPTEN